MALDIRKLKKEQQRINSRARLEIYNNLKDNLINIVLDKDLKKLFKKTSKRNKNQLSKRVISHWVKQGVINGLQNVEGGWFHFNRAELVWIEIVTQLRQFGLSLEKIKRVKENLFKNSVDSFSLLEFSLIYSVVKEPYLIIISDEGNLQLMTASTYKEQLDLDLAPHIIINFFHLANKVFPDNNFNLNLTNTNINNLSMSEIKLLYLIRTGEFSEVKIKFMKKGKFQIEGKKELQDINNLFQIIKERKGYQDINVKVENNKMVYVSTTNKIRI